VTERTNHRQTAPIEEHSLAKATIISKVNKSFA